MKNKQYFGLSSQLIKKLVKAIKPIASDTSGLADWVEGLLYEQMRLELGMEIRAFKENLEKFGDDESHAGGVFDIRRDSYTSLLREKTSSLLDRVIFSLVDGELIKEATEQFIDDVVLKSDDGWYVYPYFTEKGGQLGFKMKAREATTHMHRLMLVLDPLLQGQLKFKISSQYKFEGQVLTDRLVISNQGSFTRPTKAQLAFTLEANPAVNPESMRKERYYMNMGDSNTDIRFSWFPNQETEISKDLLKYSSSAGQNRCYVLYSILA